MSRMQPIKGELRHAEKGVVEVYDEDLGHFLGRAYETSDGSNRWRFAGTTNIQSEETFATAREAADALCKWIDGGVREVERVLGRITE